MTNSTEATSTNPEDTSAAEENNLIAEASEPGTDANVEREGTLKRVGGISPQSNPRLTVTS